MKTVKLFKSISYLLVMLFIALNSITSIYAQGGNGGGSGGGTSGSSSTGGDYSGSSYTGNSATGGDNSGSQDGSGQGGYPRGGGDQLQNTYGEIYQLKARISNESLDKGNELFNGIKTQLKTQDCENDCTNEEKLNYYHNQIQNLNNFDYGYMNEEDRKQAMEYLKTRLEYKVGIQQEIGNIEENMNENALNLTKTFLNDYEKRYQYTSDLNQKYQYERLLSISTKIQSRVGDIDTTEENRERIQNILKYMEMSMYDKIDDMEN